jgi:hypothetical protein
VQRTDEVTTARWWSWRAVKLHLTAVLAVGICLGACYWQVDRALGGNGLSWAYVFEWPFFAGYSVFLWWKLLHEDGPLLARRLGGADATEETDAPVTRTQMAGGEDEDEDEELAAYNRYLAELHVSGRPKRW